MTPKVNYTEWNGKSINDTVTTHLVGLLEHSKASTLWGLAISDGANRIIIPRHRVLSFLRMHPSVEVICFNAVAFFESLLLLAQQDQNENGAALAWALPSQYRLIDLQLLDYRVRSIGESLGRPASEVEVVEYWIDGQIPTELKSAWSKLIAGQLEDIDVSSTLLEIAEFACYVYNSLHARAQEIIESVMLSPEANRFGPLGIGLDVQGAIALARTSKAGIRLDFNETESLLKRGRQMYAQASAAIKENKGAAQCFEWDGALVRRNDKGHPVIRKNMLQGWLREKKDGSPGLFDIHNYNVFLPTQRGSRLPIQPWRWEPWVDCDDGLNAWKTLIAAADLLRIDWQEEKIYPMYEIVPEIRSSSPDFSLYRVLGVEAFRASNGYRLVVVRLPMLIARCAAAVCWVNGYAVNGRLRGYLLHEEDPLFTAAAELYAHSRRSPDNFGRFRDCFGDLQQEEQTRWLNVTDALLRCAPLGLPIPKLGNMLQVVYGMSIGDAELQRFLAILAYDIAYEYQAFVCDELLGHISDRLGIPIEQLARAVGSEDHLDTANSSLKRAISEEKPNAKLKDLAGQISINGELLKIADLSIGGRATAFWYRSHVLREAVLASADEVRKSIAFGLVASGHRLLALWQDTLLLEVPENFNNLEISRVVVRSGQTLLGELAPPCIFADRFTAFPSGEQP